MRIILLSIAFLFLAFSAQSQVLKSAGVWYFLDVDSMTARPAVLPNGTELAYVVGTKKIYYWDRGTSTWTEYSTGGGSSFNRDSIYFDASIIGSGTVSDPWGVDSTLFATIAAVGDSIAAAVANYFPLEGGTLTGTGGAGFIGLPSQGTAPGTPASGLNIFAQGSSFNWKGTDGFERQITSSLTGGRNYALPDINGTFALGTGTTDRSARWTGTNTLGAGSWSDNLTRLQAQVPVQFQSVTTAGLPTGVDLYVLENSTTGFLTRYKSGSWENLITSTGASANQVAYYSSAGKIQGSSNLTYSTNFLLTGSTNGNLVYSNTNSSSGTAATAGFLANGNNGKLALFGQTSSGYTANANIGAQAGVIYTDGTGGLALWPAAGTLRFVTGGGTGTERMRISTTGNVGVGNFSSSTIDYAFHVKNNAAVDVSLIAENTNTGTSASSSFGGKNDAGKLGLIGMSGSNYTNITAIGPNTGYIYTDGTNGFSLTSTVGAVKFHVGGSTSAAEKMRLTTGGFLGIGTTSPVEQLHITDDLRVGDSTRITTTPAHSAITGLLTRDATGWVGLASLAGGLSYSGGVLTGANIYTADGTISTGRTVTLGGVNSDYLKINGTTNDKRLDFFTTDEGYNTDGDFRARSYGNGSQSNNGSYLYYGGNVYSTGTRSFSGSFTVGSDRSIAQGGASYFYTQVRNNSGGRIAEIREVLDSTGNSYNYLKYKTDGLNASGILHISGFAKGNESTGLSLIHANTPSFLIQTNFYNSSTKFDWLRIDNLDTDTTSNRISFYNGKYAFPNASPGSGDKVLQWSSGTPSFVSLSSLSNGIYSGSGTLANHTTRALVPDDGNLFFSQTYNAGADSSFFYFQNTGGGERYVGIGMTDTASTGGASLIFGNGGIGDLSFELKTTDALSGTARVRGLDGDLLLSSSAGNISLSADVAAEVQVVGLVRAKQEAYYEITSTSSPQTFSDTYSDNFVNQGSTQASFTFLFPASPEDGQILSMTWNNAISVLTLDGNGNTITGSAVTTAVAGTRRQFKYYASASAWIKIY